MTTGTIAGQSGTRNNTGVFASASDEVEYTTTYSYWQGPGIFLSKVDNYGTVNKYFGTAFSDVIDYETDMSGDFLPLPFPP